MGAEILVVCSNTAEAKLVALTGFLLSETKAVNPRA